MKTEQLVVLTRIALRRGWNNLSWLWNSSRDPERYKQFADSRKWAFILGCNNSGTNLLNQLLAAHPDISPLPNEGQTLTSVFNNPYSYGLQRTWTEQADLFRLTDENDSIDSIRLIHDWSNCLKEKNPPVILERSPPNSIRSRWLQKVFKNSCFIGLARDGRAVAEGISRRKGVDIYRGAAHWVKVYNTLLEDAGHLKNFRWVRYEDLAENPQEAVKDLLGFIGVDTAKYSFDANMELKISNIDGEPAKVKNFNQKSFDRIPPDVFKKISAQIEPVMQKLGY